MTTCRLRVQRDTPDSGRFEWATLGNDGAVLASGEAELEHAPVRGACEVALACDLVTLDRVAAPAAQRRRLAGALRFLVEDNAIPEPDRLHVAAASSSRDSLNLAVVDRQWLATLLAKLERAGFSPQRVFPECLLPALQPHAWTVVCNGEFSFARTGEAEGFSLDSTDQGAPPVALRLALERARASGASPLAILVRTAAGTEPPDVQSWAAALGVAVEHGPAWHWAAEHHRPELNLLQGEFAARGAGRVSRQRLRRPAILAAALLAVGSLGVAVDWAAKVRERNALQGEMRAIYRETFGAGAVLVDPPLQMARALAEARQQAGQVGAGDFLALLGVAAEQVVDTRRHRVESLSYEGQALSIVLRPPEGQQAGALLEELRAKPRPRGIDLRADAAGSTGRVNLVLRVNPGRDN